MRDARSRTVDVVIDRIGAPQQPCSSFSGWAGGDDLASFLWPPAQRTEKVGIGCPSGLSPFVVGTETYKRKERPCSTYL